MISSRLSSYLWKWFRPLRSTRAIREAQTRLQRASETRRTQDQHKALMDARRARLDGLRKEVGGKPARRITVLYILAGG